MTKTCFTCRRNKLLFLFGINHTKHSIASDKGKCIECRKCTAKRFIRQDGNIVELVEGRHTSVGYEVTIKSIIKQYLQLK